MADLEEISSAHFERAYGLDAALQVWNAFRIKRAEVAFNAMLQDVIAPNLPELHNKNLWHDYAPVMSIEGLIKGKPVIRADILNQFDRALSVACLSKHERNVVVPKLEFVVKKEQRVFANYIVS
jgi:hypothetical protein